MYLLKFYDIAQDTVISITVSDFLCDIFYFYFHSFLPIIGIEEKLMLELKLNERVFQRYGEASES
jgi:hypothetical protein